jgi:hypothetical protein
MGDFDTMSEEILQVLLN